MRRAPRPRSVPLLDDRLLGRITLAGGWTVSGALIIMVTHDGGFDHARWVAFTALVVGQVVRAYANRSLDTPVTRLTPNRFLALACLVAIGIQVAIPYVPALAKAFRRRLELSDWMLVGIVAFTPAIAADLLRRKGIRGWVA